MTVRVGGYSLVGPRARNEDSFLAQVAENPLGVPIAGCVAVADGLGGHPRGDEASQKAVAVVAATWPVPVDRARMRQVPDLAWRTPEDARAVVQRADDEVTRMGNRLTDRDRYGPGSTLTFAACYGDRVFVGHIGDCRLYLWYPDGMTQRTRDMVTGHFIWRALGNWDLAEAAAQAWQKVPGTRGVGWAYTPYDAEEFVLRPGGALVVVSDGVWGALSDEQIAAFDYHADPQAAAQALVEAAVAAPGTDNATAAVLALDPVA